MCHLFLVRTFLLDILALLRLVFERGGRSESRTDWLGVGATDCRRVLRWTSSVACCGYLSNAQARVDRLSCFEHCTRGMYSFSEDLCFGACHRAKHIMFDVSHIFHLGIVYSGVSWEGVA